MKFKVFFWLFIFSFINFAYGHGDFHKMVQGLNVEIKKDPKNAKLYFLRAELKREHENFKEAYADYAYAQKLDSTYPEVHIGLANLYYDTKKFEQALVEINQYLSRNPAQAASGYLLRARVFLELKKWTEADLDFDTVIRTTPYPNIDLYIEKAKAKEFTNPPQINAAIEDLDRAILAFGNNVVVQEYAVELELKRKNFDRAVQRIDLVLKDMPRKETWLFKKGEALELAQKKEAARDIFKEAQREISQLPSRLQNTPAMRELSKKLRQKLGQ